jgi:hypothetical protein
MEDWSRAAELLKLCCPLLHIMLERVITGACISILIGLLPSTNPGKSLPDPIRMA